MLKRYDSHKTNDEMKLEKKKHMNILQIVEFGCADMNLVIPMRKLENIQHIVQVGINSN